MESIISVLEELLEYSKNNNFRGYDPYDFMNSRSCIILKKYPITRLIMTQSFKISPVNMRFFFKTSKSSGPKELSLFLSTYSKLYHITKEKRYFILATYLIRKIMEQRLPSSYLWGSAYDCHIGGILSFVGLSLIDYYKANSLIPLKKVIEKIRNNIFDKLLSPDKSYFHYSTRHSKVVLNQNSLVLRFLFMSDTVSPMNNFEFNLCQKILEDLLFSNQHKEGYWPYNLAKNRRFDFDYHQGFIIESLIDIASCQRYKNNRINEVINSGLDFYMNRQFNSSGSSKWKLNSNWPIDIHDLCQGIITFSKASNYGKSYFN